MHSNSPVTKTDLSRFLQKQPNIFLAKYLPFSVYRRYLSMIGFYYYGVNGEERKELLASLRFVLGKRFGKLKFGYILLKTYLGIFDHYYEKMINAHKSLTGMKKHVNKQISFTGKDRLNQIIEKNKGCLLVTGHFGAIEYIPLYLASNNYRPTIILRFKTEKLKAALAAKSKSVDLELIDADSPNALFKAFNAINEGRLLITLCDEIHHWRPSKKENARLFGRLVPKDRTLDILYRRLKVPTCFGIIKREKNGYDLSIHPLADGEEKISLCETAWDQLEQTVYRYPEQWYQWPKFHSEFTRYSMNRECYGN
jgi:KDO2-lipid IV(A) lauroyltransferase